MARSEPNRIASEVVFVQSPEQKPPPEGLFCKIFEDGDSFGGTLPLRFILKKPLLILKKGILVLKVCFPILKMCFPVFKKGFPILKMCFPKSKVCFPKTVNRRNCIRGIQTGIREGDFENGEAHFENRDTHFENGEAHFENQEEDFENREGHFENERGILRQGSTR